MSTEYIKTSWQDGDIITADKMNNIENGIKDVEDTTTSLKEDLSDMDDRVTALEEGGTGSGLTEDIKQALLQIASKVAYIDEDGQNYYDALESALYPPADLVRISAVYTQSGTVYDTDSLDSLKSDLVVTAHMSDSTTQTVTLYTLSGTLTAGTSTVTVSYGGKTTTFTVNVTAEPTNPFDGVNWNDGLRITGSSEYTGQNNYTTTDYVSVSDISSVTLTLNAISGNVQYYVCWYTEAINSSYISDKNGYINYNSSSYQPSTTATKPDNAQYCRVCVTKGTGGYPHDTGILDITVS